MIPEEKTTLYKSIRFEMVRAKIAFDIFFKIAGAIITGNATEQNPHIQILAFDSYSRWCGHLYEALLALQIVSDESPINDKSKGPTMDPYIQCEAQKAINRRLSLLSSGRDEFSHFTKIILNSEFSKDLRAVRNKCSFHCSLDRVSSTLLQAFINSHHEIAYALYEDLHGAFGNLDPACNQDLGEVTKFFQVAKLKIRATQH